MAETKNTNQVTKRILKPNRKLAAPTAGKQGKKPNLADTRASSDVKVDYFRFYESLYRKEITDWLEARAMMRDPFNQLSFPIQQLYKDTMLDNHLQGAFESRVLRVVNKEITLYNSNGEIDRELSSKFQARWMRHIIRKAMESIAYGYSVIFVNNLSQPTRSIIDINRENVIPLKRKVISNIYDTNSESLSIEEFPNYLIYIQLNSDHYGLLERIAPLTVYKRHSWANWDEFEQIFGMPIRIARTMINTKKHKDELQMWLETMGTANYAIFDKQTDIEIKESNRSDAYKVFFEKIQSINKEISKAVIGQTMTMDDGSSQSQANVHLEIFNQITDSDIMNVQDWLNDEFMPVLRNHGYAIPEGYYFQLNEKEELKPAEKIKIDQVLLQSGYNLDPDYIQNFYGTPLDATEPRKIATPTQPLSIGKDLKSFFV